jgi:hypothetical protein
MDAVWTGALSESDSGVARACVPLPYTLPPAQYSAGDAPWTARTAHGKLKDSRRESWEDWQKAGEKKRKAHRPLVGVGV